MSSKLNLSSRSPSRVNSSNNENSMSSNQEFKNQSLQNFQNPKSKTQQDYFKIKKELENQLQNKDIKNKRNPKQNFVDKLYLKNTENINEFFENNKRNINLIGTKEINEVPSSQALETIKTNQKNWTERIPGLKYVNPEKNKYNEELTLTPLPEKKLGKLWENEQQKKEYDKAERKAKVMRTIEYTHAITEGKKNKRIPFEELMKSNIPHKDVIITNNGIKVSHIKNNSNVNEEDKERFYSVLLQKFFRKINTICKILKKKSLNQNNNNDSIVSGNNILGNFNEYSNNNYLLNSNLNFDNWENNNFDNNLKFNEDNKINNNSPSKEDDYLKSFHENNNENEENKDNNMKENSMNQEYNLNNQNNLDNGQITENEDENNYNFNNLLNNSNNENDPFDKLYSNRESKNSLYSNKKSSKNLNSNRESENPNNMSKNNVNINLRNSFENIGNNNSKNNSIKNNENLNIKFSEMNKGKKKKI